VPAADTNATGDAGAGARRVGYYANDMAASLTQTITGPDGVGEPDQNSFGLDATGRISQVTTSSNGVEKTKETYEFGDGSDSPTAISTVTDATGGQAAATSLTRYVTFGSLGMVASLDSAGVSYQLGNLHGDTVATADNTGTIGAYSETDEYGNPVTPVEIDSSVGTGRYGYLGDAQRSGGLIGGLTLMGARLYDPASGRFLSRDSVYGGNANSYTYSVDPVNGSDTTGNTTAPIQPPAGAFGTVGLGLVAAGLTIAGVKIISGTMAAFGHIVPFPSDKVSKSGDNYSVYTIWFYPDPKTHSKKVWKYGMTGVGASRPNSQLGKCSKFSRIRCNFTWVKEGGLSKWSARALEASLIYAYLKVHKECPPGQNHRVCT